MHSEKWVQPEKFCSRNTSERFQKNRLAISHETVPLPPTPGGGYPPYFSSNESVTFALPISSISAFRYVSCVTPSGLYLLRRSSVSELMPRLVRLPCMLTPPPELQILHLSRASRRGRPYANRWSTGAPHRSMSGVAHPTDHPRVRMKTP